jgi:hypothetical protein
LIDFPEVDEIGFGHSNRKVKGLGLGDTLNALLADTLRMSPALQERGLRHIEELQLISIGVGPDRVSDITANALKTYLVDYTQQQAKLWDIPVTTDIPVHHYFDFENWEWSDGFFDLPLNPVSGLPIILVPRRIVRQLPWINYTDYARTDFRMYLRAKQRPRNSRRQERGQGREQDLNKTGVVEVTRSKIELLDQYVSRKERESADAEPSLGIDAISDPIEYEVGEELIRRLGNLPPGHASSADYQRLVYEIINYLFEPDLTDGRVEERTHHGTERRDIIYANEAERSFLKYVRETYLSLFLLFEIKNVREVELEHINQVATYLGSRLGMFGFIVTRYAVGENVIKKTYSVYNDTPSMPRKTILFVTDADLTEMIQLKQSGKPPGSHLQKIYRLFILKIQ